ncbi:MAG: hypothetical protein M3N97_10720 [Pseudomonadota bacterium]|nr:hypothetical protein [Pseudomonadota bacterium]
MNGSVAVLQALSAQLALFQALLLAASAIHKAGRWPHSRDVMHRFGGVPRAAAGALLTATLAVELLTSAALLVPAYRATGAMLAALLWTLYLGLIARAIVQRRRDVDCGCTFGASSASLGAFQLTRNTVLAGLAVGIASVSATRGSVPAQGSQVLGAIALLALYGALDQVMALQPLRRGEIS